jgi:hypothetical protein
MVVLDGPSQSLMKVRDENVEYCCGAFAVLDGPAGKGEQAPLFAGEAPDPMRIPAGKAKVFGVGMELLQGLHFSVRIGPILQPEAFEIFLQNGVDLLVISRDVELYPFRRIVYVDDIERLYLPVNAFFTNEARRKIVIDQLLQFGHESPE